MTEDITSPEQKGFTPEKRPEGQKLETAVSPSPEEIRELVKGGWADDWRAIKEKLTPEQIPKDEQGRVLRTKAVVTAAFPEASELTQKITLDVLRRQLEEAEIEVTDTNVSFLPLAKNLRPLVEKLEAKPPEPTISEADKAKLRQFDLLDKTAKGLRLTVNSQEKVIHNQKQEIQSLRAKLEKPPVPVAPPPEKKPFAVAAENLSSNLKAVKAIDLLVHQGNLMANEKAKQADTRALLNEALSKYPDLESLRSALQKLIEARITVSREGLSEEEFRQAEKLKRQEYLESAASLLTDLEKVYEVKPARKEPLAPRKEAKERVEIPKTLFEKLKAVNQLLSRENPKYRPEDRKGRPGGLIELRKDIPVILIPDIHARPDYLAQALLKTPGDWEKFLEGKLQVVCLGDGPHSENEARWKKAYQEYLDRHNYENFIGPATEEEMGKTFGTMEMIMALKLLCPDNFHYLRGNHDELEKANFGKFAQEGPQTKAYVKAKFGEEFYRAYCQFEENLPIAARGTNFIALHAEPSRRSTSANTRAEIIDYKDHQRQGQIGFDLRWERDTDSETIAQFLQFMGISPNGYLIGGHSDREKNFHQEGSYISIGFRHEHSSIARIEPSGEVKIVNISRDPHTAEELKRHITEAVKKK